MKRSSGVLLHVTSLPSPYGIGTLGQAAYDFIEFLEDSEQTYWQVLPLTTTGYGDSPYMSFSAFAGNPNLIDLDRLIEEDYIEKQDVQDLMDGAQSDHVDYDFAAKERRPVLEKAVQSFTGRDEHQAESFQIFYSKQADWLLPYAVFMTLKEKFDLKPWYEWPDEYKFYQEDILYQCLQSDRSAVDYHLVTQYWFFKQWQEVKIYAHRNHIQIIGDLPIYVAGDSVEMWQHPEMFLVDDQQKPLEIAGFPPDHFHDDGQFWGNPIYDWEYMKEDNYSWWVKRLIQSFQLYDKLRLDHFRGFESYWSIPYGSESSRQGRWVQGPGIDFFNQIKDQLGELDIIAEVLGAITPEVREMFKATGFPGMKILQYGFNGKEDSEHLPHHCSANNVGYIGTHDNETAEGWYHQGTATSKIKAQADAYLKRQGDEKISQAMIRALAASTNRLVIYQMQDLLHLDNEARMNRPGTIGGNWDWRMDPDALTPQLMKELKEITELYFRHPIRN